MKDSKIEWTHHTFNPVRGCVEVSPGCAHCYAAAMSLRNPTTLGVWGKFGTRIVASEKMWQEPLRWDAEAAKAGLRSRVFCASLADVFEDWPGRLHFPAKDEDGKPTIHVAWWSPAKGITKAGQTTMRLSAGERPAVMQDMRLRLFELIRETPNLDWLLLTKRPENVMGMVPVGWRAGLPANVWMGTTVEDQERANVRIPELLKIPAKVRFLSCEPLLEPVHIAEIRDSAGGEYMPLVGALTPEPRIHWVICGGESGPKSRPMKMEWAWSLQDQCRAASVPFFFKQWGGGNKKAAGRMLDGRTWDELPL